MQNHTSVRIRAVSGDRCIIKFIMNLNCQDGQIWSEQKILIEDLIVKGCNVNVAIRVFCSENSPDVQVSHECLRHGRMEEFKEYPQSLLPPPSPSLELYHPLNIPGQTCLFLHTHGMFVSVRPSKPDTLCSFSCGVTQSERLAQKPANMFYCLW